MRTRFYGMSFIYTAGFVAASCLPVLTSCGSHQRPSHTREEWNAANDPLRFLPPTFERKFDALPKEASLEKTPWSDTYWPTTAAGISQRWNNSGMYGEENFKYTPPKLEQLKTMTPADIAALSPAEKFDIMNRDYSYRLTMSERQRTYPDAPGWEGLCHGWAAAALVFDEPKPVMLTNADGIAIPFGAADVKGLLDLYVGNFASTRTYFVAERCNIDLNEDPTAANNPECRDTNAGTFHLVLSNKIGFDRQGFVADVVRDLQVWNHPVYSFTSKVLDDQATASPGAAPGTVREVTVETEMNYISETGALWEHGKVYKSSRRYNYRVEVNANGDIIGGAWLNDERPDFLWMQDAPNFYNTDGIAFSALRNIFQESVNAPGTLPNPAGI